VWEGDRALSLVAAARCAMPSDASAARSSRSRIQTSRRIASAQLEQRNNGALAKSPLYSQIPHSAFMKHLAGAACALGSDLQGVFSFPSPSDHPRTAPAGNNQKVASLFRKPEAAERCKKQLPEKGINRMVWSYPL
jgi:hypothetical protein